MLWHGLIWALVLVTLALWSSLALGAGSLLQEALHLAAGESGRIAQALEQAARHLAELQLPPWLVQLLGLDALQGLVRLLQSLAPWLQDLLAYMPGLLPWLMPLLWLTWGLGALGLLLGGALLSALLVLMRRTAPSQPRPAP